MARSCLQRSGAAYWSVCAYFPGVRAGRRFRIARDTEIGETPVAVKQKNVFGFEVAVYDVLFKPSKRGGNVPSERDRFLDGDRPTLLRQPVSKRHVG